MKLKLQLLKQYPNVQVILVQVSTNIALNSVSWEPTKPACSLTVPTNVESNGVSAYSITFVLVFFFAPDSLIHAHSRWNMSGCGESQQPRNVRLFYSRGPQKRDKTDCREYQKLLFLKTVQLPNCWMCCRVWSLLDWYMWRKGPSSCWGYVNASCTWNMTIWRNGVPKHQERGIGKFWPCPCNCRAPQRCSTRGLRTGRIMACRHACRRTNVRTGCRSH